MIERLKNAAIFLGVAFALGFSLFQLYCAWRYGQILAQRSEPPRYVAGVVLYCFTSIVFGGLLAVLTYG